MSYFNTPNNEVSYCYSDQSFNTIFDFEATISQPTTLYTKWAASIEINEDNFPDESFRSKVSSECDTDQDGYLSVNEINQITVLDLCDSNIKSLVGIEYFSELSELVCAYNQLSALDVSKNTSLL